MIRTRFRPKINDVKRALIIGILPILLTGCGLFKKDEEVGPYGDQRSGWEKLRTYEEDRYDDWADKWMHREEYQFRKRRMEGKKKNP